MNQLKAAPISFLGNQGFLGALELIFWSNSRFKIASLSKRTVLDSSTATYTSRPYSATGFPIPMMTHCLTT